MENEEPTYAWVRLKLDHLWDYEQASCNPDLLRLLYAMDERLTALEAHRHFDIATLTGTTGPDMPKASR